MAGYEKATETSTSEAQLVARLIALYPLTNSKRTSRTFVVRLSAVRVEYSSIGDKLQKLSRELLSKKNTGSNNNNGLWSCRLKLPHSIHNHIQSLSTTSRIDQLTFVVLLHCNITAFLMRTEKRNHYELKCFKWSCI